jgi:acetyl-CoA acyltransferase 2
VARKDFPHIVIAGVARTPIGLKCGALSGFSAEQLGALASIEAIARSGIDRKDIDAVVGANVYQFTAPGAQDIYFPRNIALRCELDIDTPSLMVQRICGSGIQTLITGFGQIAMPDCVDDTQVVLCAAAETMSRAPQIVRSPRVSGPSFWEFERDGRVEDSILASLNHDLAGTAMMLTADEYGSSVGITRQECDAFTVVSQERAIAANRKSHLNGGDALKGMFALDAVDHDGRAVHLAYDECVRETSIETLEKLPGFTPNKLVSPGNASEIADGGAAAVIASRPRAEKLGLPTRWEIVGFGVSGVEPKVMGRGPVPAIRIALEKAGLKQADIGLWEINEAFAAQYLGVEKELKLDREIVNVNGGAIAIGHPLAATGTRLIADLVYEMDRRGERYGCVSACIGGGQGAAMIIEDTTKSK